MKMAGDFDISEPGCPDEDGNGPTGYVGNYADWMIAIGSIPKRR